MPDSNSPPCTGNNCVKRLSDVVWDFISVKKICNSPDAKFATLQQMVDYYRKKLLPATEKWLSSLTKGQDPSLWFTNFICGEANILRNPANGKFCKNIHQRRRTGELIILAREILEAYDFSKCTTFSEILDKTAELTKDLKGFGKLCTYDFALRYAFHRGIRPEVVYIHAGVDTGLQSLSYIYKDIEVIKDNIHGKRIENLSSLPKEIAQLDPMHIENFLCIFHDHLLRLENHTRGERGDAGPNFGPYLHPKEGKRKSQELKDEKMRRDLNDIYTQALKDSKR